MQCHMIYIQLSADATSVSVAVGSALSYIELFTDWFSNQIKWSEFPKLLVFFPSQIESCFIVISLLDSLDDSDGRWRWRWPLCMLFIPMKLIQSIHINRIAYCVLNTNQSLSFALHELLLSPFTKICPMSYVFFPSFLCLWKWVLIDYYFVAKRFRSTPLLPSFKNHFVHATETYSKMCSTLTHTTNHLV